MVAPFFVSHIPLAYNHGAFNVSFLMKSVSSKQHPEVGTWAKIRKKQRSAGSRRFHYSFDLENGSSGFVLHKKLRKKGHLRVFLDSNENGIFDRKDELLVRGPLKKPFVFARPGALLRRSEVGVITAKVHAMDDHSSHDHHHHDHAEVHHASSKGALGINAIGYEHMSLWTSAMGEVFHDHGDAHNHGSMMS